MNKKVISLGVLILLLITLLGYLFFGPTAIRQGINMKRAGKHLPIIKDKLAANPIFKDIRLHLGTALAGSILVIGTVPADKDIIELKSIIDGTNPPVEVDYVVFSDDSHKWADLSDGLKCLVKLEKNAFVIGETIEVNVFIRNSTDKAVIFGGSYYDNDPKYGPAFRSGIDPVLKDSNNTEVKPISTARFKDSSAGRELKPGESEYFSFNLTDCCRLDTPGKYLFYLSFTKKYSGFADGQSNTVEFELVENKK